MGEMDYDKIVEGRRRNWDALKPEERRALEKEEARQKRKEEMEEKIKSGKRSAAYERLRRAGEDLESEADRQRFRRVLRQSGVLVALFVGVIVTIYAANYILDKRRYKQFVAESSSYNQVLLEGETIDDMSEPVKALATWRSAWMEGDTERIVDTFSTAYMERLTKGKTARQIRGEYQRLKQSGNLDATIAIATAFDSVEAVRLPGKPWTKGELAVFRSSYIARADEEPPGKRYTIALTWEPDYNEWRFADMREAEFFSVKWERESFIQQKVVGGGAVRYDEEGNELRRGRE